MATDSMMRLIGTGETGNWAASKDTAMFTSSTSNVSGQELGLLMNGHRFHGDRKLTGPSRCGSAPPTVEGSLVSTGNIRDWQNSNFGRSFESLSIAVEGSASDEQLRRHQAYLAGYYSNDNLNPRLPRPLVSQENRRLVHQIGAFSDRWGRPPYDDNNKGSVFLALPTLSTHKEEPEDDKSPSAESNDWADKNTGFVSNRFMSPSQGRHKTIVDLIQEDFPRTPSPVYNNQSHPSSHNATEQATDQDALIYTSHDSSINTANLALETPTVGGSVRNLDGLTPKSDIATSPVPCSVSSDRTVSPHPGLKGKSGSNGAISDIRVSSDTVAGPNIGRTETKNLKISNDGQRSQYARRHSQENNLHPQDPPTQLLIGQSPLITQGMHYPNNSMEYFSSGQSKVPSVEFKPVLQSTGSTIPLFTTAAAYGTSYYPNLQPSSLIAPPFSIGGYAMNTSFAPPLMTGYPPQGSIPVPFDSHASLSFNGTSAVPTGGSFTPGVDLQHYYKFYGPLGIAIQPSFPDPLYVPYFPHPPVDAYAGAGRYDSLASGGNPFGTLPGNYNPQRGPSLDAYSPNQRPQVLRGGGVNATNVRSEGITSPNYYGSSPNIGVLMQYPTSPHSSQVYHGSPGAGTCFSGRKPDNLKLSPSSGRAAGAFVDWQGQRGCRKINDPKSYSFLEELKSSKGGRFDSFELSDIAGRIVEFSADQHGSRFIQQKLETCSMEEKASVFEEVLPHASRLMTDVFGNYVIQKFLEHGNPEQRNKLANQLTGHILPLSLQMYGCRVIQKALEVIEIDHKTRLIHELDGNVMRCVRDQNGNHVIQKCIECVPTEKISFIISAFRGQVPMLSMHPYGCRVIQRVLEHCTDKFQSQFLVDEILRSVCILAQDQYGNYVTQHVLERGKPHERNQIINKLAGQVVQMSQHKFASNVIEKCLEYGDTAEQELLIEEIIGQTEGNDNLLVMMKDQFANYVVQKILETCTDKQREILLQRMRKHLPALKKYTYGKHIVARVEQLCTEESHISESSNIKHVDRS